MSGLYVVDVRLTTGPMIRFAVTARGHEHAKRIVRKHLRDGRATDHHIVDQVDTLDSRLMQHGVARIGRFGRYKRSQR